MKSQTSTNLSEELKSAGASDSEVNELVALANDLKGLKKSAGPSVRPVLPGRRQNRRRMLIPAGIAALAGLVLGMAIVMLSQTVLPGSPLYPVQKLSDNVAVSVNPDYRGAVMMKRAQEVKQLIAAHAGSKLVLATLSDYQAQAATYKSASANYAVFEYCKADLQQAAVTAPGPERQAINNVLSSFKNV